MKGKKILSLVLSLVLLISVIGVMPAKAAETYSSITFTGIDANNTKLNTDAARWDFYLQADGYTGSGWDYKYEGFTYEIDGVSGTTMQVSSTGGNGLWCAIPESEVSISEGTIITIKAGNYDAQEGTEEGISITEDFKLVFLENKLVANLEIVDVAQGQVTTYNKEKGHLYFNLQDKKGNIVGPGTPTWDSFLTPAKLSGARYEMAELSSSYHGVFMNDQPLNTWDFYTNFKYTPELNSSFFMNLSAYTITAGTTITIRGYFTSVTNWENGNCYFLKEFSFKYDGNDWSFVRPTQYTNITLTGTHEQHSGYSSNDNRWNLYLTNTGGVESEGWAYKYQGFNYEKDGVPYTMAQVSTTETALLHTLWCYIPVSVLPADAPNGTKIVIKAGNYDWSDENSYQGLAIQNDLTLVVQDGKLINEIATGTPTFTSGNGAVGFYFSAGETTFPYDGGWSYETRAEDTADSGLFFEGTKKPVVLKKIDQDSWYVDLENSEFTPSAGDVITIKGTFIYNANDGSKHRIKFNEASFVFNGTQYEAYVGSTYNDVTITGLGDQSQNGSAWFIYAHVNANLPGTAWEHAFKDVAVWVGDTDITNSVIVKKGGDTSLFFDIPATVLSTTPDVGTRITIKQGNYEGYKYENGQFTDNLGNGIHITADYVMEWNGTAWGDPDNTAYTAFTISDLNASTAKQGDRWFAYFGTTNTLPGESWYTHGGVPEDFKVKVSVNDGATFEVTTKKAEGNNVLFMEIPYTYLPTDTEAKVTIKAGKYKSNVQEIGYNITGDYTFYTTPISWSEEKLSVTMESPQFKWVTGHENTTAQSFIIGTSTNDGTNWNSDWSAHLKPVPTLQQYDGEKGILWLTRTETGLYKNGVPVNLASTGPEWVLKKLTETEYYVNVAEAGAAASEGDYYQIKGYFIDGNDKIVYYETGYLTLLEDSSWKASADNLQDTGVDADINSDNSVNSLDLVRLIRQKDNPMLSINGAKEDINYDGSVDTYDISALRKVIVGQLYYMNGSSVPYGTPAVNNSKRIEKLAYACPVIGTWAGDKFYSEFKSYSDAEIDAIFQEYKATGLTLLNTEFVAHLTTEAVDAYNNDALRAYLNGAQRNGLGVIVRCDYLEFLLKASDLEGTYKDWQGVMDHYVNYLSKWSSFKGFMMSDELGTTYASNYVAVAGYLHEKYPNLILFSSELPNYAEGLTGESAYKDYVNTFGTASGYFTYDNYGLRSSDPLMGNITYEVENTWYTNLKWVAENSLNSDGTQKYIPGVTIQAFSMPAGSSWWNTYEKYAPEQAEDIGFQVYTSLAWGMQSINYFSYTEHPGDSQVANEMELNPLVKAAVTSVNKEIDKFASVYKHFTWKKTLDLQNTTNSSTGNSRLASAKVSGARTLIGCMKDADGFDGYMIANAAGPRTSTAANVTLTFNNATKAIAYIDGEKTTVNLTNGAYTFNVGVGEGIFVIPIR